MNIIVHSHSCTDMVFDINKALLNSATSGPNCNKVPLNKNVKDSRLMSCKIYNSCCGFKETA